jgi:hypothetical protein
MKQVLVLCAAICSFSSCLSPAAAAAAGSVVHRFLDASGGGPISPKVEDYHIHPAWKIVLELVKDNANGFSMDSYSSSYAIFNCLCPMLPCSHHLYLEDIKLVRGSSTTLDVEITSSDPAVKAQDIAGLLQQELRDENSALQISFGGLSTVMSSVSIQADSSTASRQKPTEPAEGDLLNKVWDVDEETSLAKQSPVYTRQIISQPPPKPEFRYRPTSFVNLHEADYNMQVVRSDDVSRQFAPLQTEPDLASQGPTSALPDTRQPFAKVQQAGPHFETADRLLHLWTRTQNRKEDHRGDEKLFGLTEIQLWVIGGVCIAILLVIGLSFTPCCDTHHERVFWAMIFMSMCCAYGIRVPCLDDKRKDDDESFLEEKWDKKLGKMVMKPKTFVDLHGHEHPLHKHEVRHKKYKCPQNIKLMLMNYVVVAFISGGTALLWHLGIIQPILQQLAVYLFIGLSAALLVAVVMLEVGQKMAEHRQVKLAMKRFHEMHLASQPIVVPIVRTTDYVVTPITNALENGCRSGKDENDESDEEDEEVGEAANKTRICC